MLIPFGILSAAGAAGVAGTYELISTTILGSTTSTVSFTTSSLGTDYKHIQIRAVLQQQIDFGGTYGGNIQLRMNGDTGNNYAFHYLRGDGSNVASAAESSVGRILINRLPYANPRNDKYGSLVVDVLDFASTTKNKTIRSLSGVPFAGDDASWVTLTSGLWNSTALMTSISLTAGAYSGFYAGSRFSLYGIRG